MSNSSEVTVSFTAKIIAAGRALETNRTDALFIDPFAQQLAGAEAISAATPRFEQYNREGRPFTTIRTRFFDDFLKTHSTNIKQVVLLGSGMDTRAFRLDWQPGTKFYEIDQQDVMHYKEEILKGVEPKCERYSICADLKESLWGQLLLELGYQPEQPTLWLLEGFLYYLNPEEVHNLLTKITTMSVVGSWLGVDMMNSIIANGSDNWSKYWHSSCDQPESFFHDYGWEASVIQPGEPGASFERFTCSFPDRNTPNSSHLFLVTAYRV